MPYGEGPPSLKAVKRVEEAHNYAASILNPVIEEVIEYLMVVQPEDPIGAFYRYLLDKQEGKLEPAVKKELKSQAEILEELKPVVTAMMQKMVESAAEDPTQFMVDHLKGVVESTPAS